MDPLSLLRDFNLKGRVAEVSTSGDRVNFGGSYVFPLTAYIAFKNAAKEFYTLEIILNLLLNRNLSHAEYIRRANEKKVGAVAFTDRRKLLDFLDGKADLQLEAPGEPLGAAAQPAVAEEEQPAAKRARTEGDGPAAAAAVARTERQLRNRNTMLLAPNKDFNRVLAIVEKAVATLRSKSAAPPAAVPPGTRAGALPPPPPLPPPPAAAVGAGAKSSGRFDREVAKDQLREMGGEAAASLASGIDMYGAYNKASVGQKPPPPPPPAAAPAVGSKRPAPAPAPIPTSVHAPAAAPRGGGGAAGVPAKPKRGGVPIIIVPSGLTSMVNMYNAQPFLEAGRYVPAAEAHARANGQKPSLVVVNRTAGKASASEAAPYHVVDKPPAKGSPDWQRVVAVITQGAKWQFKDFPFKGAAQGDMLETFRNVCGFYLHYSDEKVPETVSNWNVKRYALHRTNRHNDTKIMLDMYHTLDTFLLSRKSSLSF